MAGPLQKNKISLGSKDSSYLISDSFSSIIKHILLAVITGAIAWAFAAILKEIIVHSNEYLFSNFQHDATYVLSSAHGDDLVKPEINTPRTRSILEHMKSPWIFLSIIMIGAFVRAFLFRSKAWHTSQGDGATDTITYFLNTYNQSGEQQIVERYSRPTFIEAIRRMFITALTLGAGGSGGLEGPIIPIGESIGSGVCKKFGIKDQNTLRTIQIAGIAAAVCTLLNTPFSSALFALEVAYAERIVYRTFLYSIFSVITAFYLNRLIFTSEAASLFHIPQEHAYTLMEYVQVSIVAIFLSAPCGLGLKLFFRYLKKKTQSVPILLAAPIGALCVALIALGLWFWIGIEPKYILGMSEGTLSDLLMGSGSPLLQVWWILLVIIAAKILSTGFTLMTGGSAGLLVPAMILGGTMGAVVFHLHYFIPGLTHSSPNIFIIAGIASALVAVIEVPLASIALVIEMFGSVYAPAVLLAVSVSHLLTRKLKNHFNISY